MMEFYFSPSTWTMELPSSEAGVDDELRSVVSLRCPHTKGGKVSLHERGGAAGSLREIYPCPSSCLQPLSLLGAGAVEEEDALCLSQLHPGFLL